MHQQIDIVSPAHFEITYNDKYRQFNNILLLTHTNVLNLMFLKIKIKMAYIEQYNVCCTLRSQQASCFVPLCVNYMVIVPGLSVIILDSHIGTSPWVIRPPPLIIPYNLLLVQNVTLVISANQ